MSKSYFLFKTNEGHYIVENKDVQKVPKPREMLIRAATVEAVREYATKMKIDITHDTARERTRKHTEEGRQRIREAKLGENHPAVQRGRSQEFRDKVSKTMKGTRQGEKNPMYGHKHRDSTRQKMSEARRKRGKYKYICGPEGVTTIPEHEPIPEGWVAGAKYDPYKPTDLHE